MDNTALYGGFILLLVFAWFLLLREMRKRQKLKEAADANKLRSS